ncbi:MAG TPA: NUDIX domain-containing protein [Candidatus Saccharibacteria bacterium]|nr:NUDIX domain-containing protein [Candidatus Saccharibacteria bacterium]
MPNKPGVGLGVIIENEQGQVFIGKRTGSHAPHYSIPGGKLELGETFEQGAIREIQEEHGITIVKPKVIAVTNNLETYRAEGIHFISVILLAKAFEGEPSICEPDKCEEILWADPTSLPQPHFDASRLAIECYLQEKPYVGIR